MFITADLCSSVLILCIFPEKATVAYLPQPEGLFKLRVESFNKLLGY